MPRVVPSDVVKAADRMFPDMVKSPTSSPGIVAGAVPGLVALADLVDAVAPELVTLDSEQYVALTANVAYMRALAGAFIGHSVVPFKLQGHEHNPVAIVRAALAACPDEAPALGTTGLLFITDLDLRESIRLDISAANNDLAQGEWKGATVLAGSAVEALLLWALQEHQKAKPEEITTAVGTTLKQNPGAGLEGQGWHLHEYVEVAAHLKLIKDDTARLVRLAKDARNLVHPGRAARLGQKCDRATALGALAAVEAVARDLTP